MPYSTRLIDYIGQGLAAAKPVTPNVPSGAIVYYYATDTSVLYLWRNGAWAVVPATIPIEIQVACSDETTAITIGTAKATFRTPCAITLTAVRASVTTAPTGTPILIDIKEAGLTVLSTKLMINATSKTSVGAATPYVISDASLADDAEITIDFNQVGSTVAGAGVKVTLIGVRA